MSITTKTKELSQFLVNAKIAAYASGSDEFTVSPSLTDAHQLEYGESKLLYRDIYYGGLHFVGMETVFNNGQITWGMSYYGGGRPGSSDEQIAGMPPVLKAALRQIPLEAPFRGPAAYQEGDYIYENEIHGDISSFHGTEIISLKGQAIYQLHYSGGMVE